VRGDQAIADMQGAQGDCAEGEEEEMQYVANSNKIVWPHLYTCPAWTRRALDRNGLGETIINPVFSDREKMLCASNGCLDCGYRTECNGPVEYAPVPKSAKRIQAEEKRRRMALKKLRREVTRLEAPARAKLKVWRKKLGELTVAQVAWEDASKSLKALRKPH
jgi:hypothetical protein